MSSNLVTVVGPSGFVGSSVVKALTLQGASVRPVSAPRLNSVSPDRAWAHAVAASDERQKLTIALQGSGAVVIAAGVPDASGRHLDALISANSTVPALVGLAARDARVGRVVHVSSAAVQGDVRILDDSNLYRPFSPYSESKMLGEILFHRACPDGVIYRPPGVHGPGRKITKALVRFARSPLSSVAGAGDANTPQVLIDNVGDALAFLALASENPPKVVNHPSEGISCRDLLFMLGGRRPYSIPVGVASVLLGTIGLGRRSTVLRANARRLQIMWFGQDQGPSWLTTAGWAPPKGPEEWIALGAAMRLISEFGEGNDAGPDRGSPSTRAAGEHQGMESHTRDTET